MHSLFPVMCHFPELSYDLDNIVLALKQACEKGPAFPKDFKSRRAQPPQLYWNNVPRLLERNKQQLLRKEYGIKKKGKILLRILLPWDCGKLPIKLKLGYKEVKSKTAKVIKHSKFSWIFVRKCYSKHIPIR